MVRDDLYITVPTYFRCPISLDVMRSPVSLCTGVTYDRTSIQRWLDGGNNTCPATMQLLHSKDLIPNHTLHRLIQIWSTPSPPPSLPTDHATEIIGRLLSFHTSHSNCLDSSLIADISRLTSFAAESEENARFLAESGGRILPSLVSLIAKIKDLSHLEKIIRLCNALLQNRAKIEDENAVDCRVQTMDRDFTSSIVMVLKEKGRPQLRAAAAKLLDLMAEHLCLETHSISEEDEIYSVLLALITVPDPVTEAADASLNLLSRLAQPRKNRCRMVLAGGVRALSAALEADMSAPATEKVLRLLEMASACREGRSDICRDEICVTAIVRKLLKVSPAATEHAVAVLWIGCCLFGDRRAAAAAAEGNAAAKVLLLLQRDCSPEVRRMCGELLRVFRRDWKGSGVCLYDTKGTHIMPL